MKGALVAFIAKVEGVVRDKFQTPTLFASPIKNPGGATDCEQAIVQFILIYVFSVLLRSIGGHLTRSGVLETFIERLILR